MAATPGLYIYYHRHISIHTTRCPSKAPAFCSFWGRAPSERRSAKQKEPGAKRRLRFSARRAVHDANQIAGRICVAGCRGCRLRVVGYWPWRIKLCYAPPLPSSIAAQYRAGPPPLPRCLPPSRGAAVALQLRRRQALPSTARSMMVGRVFLVLTTGACQFGYGVGGFTTNFIHSRRRQAPRSPR